MRGLGLGLGLGTGRNGPGVLSIGGTPSAATKDVAYSFTPSFGGGTPAYTFTKTAGTFPTGLTLNSSTGVVSGTPTVAGTSSGITLRITDNVAATADLTGISFVVTAAVAITNSPGTTATVGSAYTYTPTTSGGRTTFVWSIVNRPSWATFNTSTGVLTGTPTGAETDTSINITVTDADGRTASTGAFTITVSAATAITMGALTKAGVLVYATSATISSGDASGHWQITGGYLSPSATGDTADMNLGPYTLNMSDGGQIVVTIEANCYDVRTQANYNAVATPALVTAGSGGRFAFLASGPYVLNTTDTFGEMARNTVFTVPVIWKARYPLATKPQITDPITVTSDNLEWYDLSWAASTAQKVAVINSARAYAHLHWERCEFHGVMNALATDHASWANQDTITTDGGGNDVAANIIDCWFDISKVPVKLSGKNLSFIGNLVSDFWDTGIQFSNLGNAGTAWVITDNVFIRPWSRGALDTDGDHPDTVLGSGNNTSTADCLVTFSRNRAVHGGSRGAFGGYNFRNLNGTGKWVITGGGNMHCGADCVQSFTVHDASSCNLTYNTFVNGAAGASADPVDIGFETGNNTHTFTHNIVESTAPTVLGSSNVRLGNSASNATYLTAFAGPNLDLSTFASTLADLMSNYAPTASGPANLNGGANYGAIVPSVVTFASASPGHAGASGP